jgi:hypothetical protein
MIGVVILILAPASWVSAGIGFLVLGGGAIGFGVVMLKRQRAEDDPH